MTEAKPARHSNAIALLVGIGLSIALLGLAELVNRSFLHTPRGVAWSYPPGYETRDAAGTVAASPGRHRVTLTDVERNALVYDVTYTVDRYGRRATGREPNPASEEFLLFFGGSFTFGEGVEDDESFPARVAARAPGRNVYNYAFHGLGPFDVLAKLETIDFAAQVPEPRGDVFYLFIDHHVRRVVGSSAIVDWQRSYAYYEPGLDGRLVRNGSFQSAHPLRTLLLRWISKSTLLRDIGVEVPTWNDPAGIAAAARVIAQMKRTVDRRLPGSRFWLVIHPSARLGPALARELAGSGVAILDYAGLYDGADPRYRLGEKDRHPSALAHDLLARRLVDDLELRRASAN